MKLKLNALICTGLFLVGISVAITQNITGFDISNVSIVEASHQQNHDKIEPAS